MKRKLYKTLLSVLCIVAAVFVFTIPAFAQNDTDVSIDSNMAESSATNSPEENPFDSLYRVFDENSNKILSLLSCVGTLIIALLYKKGLVPGLKNAISSFKAELVEIKNDNINTRNNSLEYGEKIERLGIEISTAAKKIEKLEQILLSEDSAKEKQILGTVLKEQIELLYDIFMSSSLPEYKKEAVSARISKMKEIAGDE